MNKNNELESLQKLKLEITNEILFEIKNIFAHCSSALISPENTYTEEGSDSMASKYKQRVKIGVDTNGNAVYQWAYANNIDDLNLRIAELIMPRVTPSEPVKGQESPLWEDYSSQWFDVFKRPTVRERTLAAEKGRMQKHVIPAFEGKMLHEISTTDVMTVLNSKSQYKQSYLKDIMSLMKQVFKSAVEDGYISRSPMDSSRIKNPSKIAPEERKPLTLEEQNDIINSIPLLSDESDRRFMAFLMFTPMRPSEIYGLLWEDIDFENGLIHIERALTFASGKSFLNKTKTDKSVRNIPIDPRLAKFLEPHLESGVVVCRSYRGKQGEYHTYQSSKRSWERIKKEIDVHGMTPYIGRHTFATNMSKAGVSMKTAMSMMGHTDERMLVRHYVHTDCDDLKLAGQAVSKFIMSE